MNEAPQTTEVKFDLPGEVVPERLYTPEALAKRIGKKKLSVDKMIREGLPTREIDGFSGRWVLGSDFIAWTKPTENCREVGVD